MTSSEALPPAILQRKAVVYVRQSTRTKVESNTEGRRRQYELVEVARRRGFRTVEVIDDDLGRSASGMVARPGFEKLVAALCAGEIGAVFCFDREGQVERRGVAELDLRQAQYDAGLAERRYAACDPDNRAVAVAETTEGHYAGCRPPGALSQLELLTNVGLARPWQRKAAEGKQMAEGEGQEANILQPPRVGGAGCTPPSHSATCGPGSRDDEWERALRRDHPPGWSDLEEAADELRAGAGEGEEGLAIDRQ